MNYRSMSKALIIALVFSLFIFVSYEVFAYSTWQYATQKAVSQQSNTDITLSNWDFAPSDIPNTPQGQKQEDIIEKLGNDTIGMNKPDSTVNVKIDERLTYDKETYGNMDRWSGAGLEEELGVTDPNIKFVIYFPQDADPNIRYIFTYYGDLGTNSQAIPYEPAHPRFPIGEMIYPVYKTTMVLNPSTNQWEKTKTELGSAPSAYYKNAIRDSFLVETPSFEPSQWVAGEQGTQSTNAIYTYVNQSKEVAIDNQSKVIYLKMKANNMSHTITISNDQLPKKIKVFDSKMSKVQVTKTNNKELNETQYTWDTTPYKTYYIEITAKKTFTYTLT